MIGHKHRWTPIARMGDQRQVRCVPGCEEPREVSEATWRLLAMDIECPKKCGPVIMGEDNEPLCNCGHFGGSGETLTKGPWPLSQSEERILRGVAFIIAGAMVHGRGSGWTGKEAEDELKRLAPLLADLARAAIEEA